MLPCICQPPRSLGGSREEEKKKRSKPQASRGVLDFPPPSQQPTAPGALLSPSSILQNPNTHLGSCLGAQRCEIHPPAAAQQMPRRFGDLSWLQRQGEPRRKVAEKGRGEGAGLHQSTPPSNLPSWLFCHSTCTNRCPNTERFNFIFFLLHATFPTLPASTGGSLGQAWGRICSAFAQGA